MAPVRPTLLKVARRYLNYPEEGGAPFRDTATDRLRCLLKFLEIRFKNTHFFTRIPYGSGKKILDVGCGNGSYLRHLNQLGWNAEQQLFGIDFPNPLLAELRKASGINIIEGDFLDTEFPPESFDIVTMRHVLEHFGDPLAALRSVHGMLKPGGSVLIAVPNFRSVEAMLLFREKWHHVDAPRHLFHFSPGTLKLVLQKTGFSVEELHLKKSITPAAESIRQSGIAVTKSLEKYLISPVFEILRLFGFSGELLCRASKKT